MGCLGVGVCLMVGGCAFSWAMTSFFSSSLAAGPPELPSLVVSGLIDESGASLPTPVISWPALPVTQPETKNETKSMIITVTMHAYLFG